MLRLKYLLFTVILLAFSACQSPRSASHKGVIMAEFKISGNQVIKCPVSNTGPMPAVSGPYKMQVAGIMTGRNGSYSSSYLHFTFGISKTSDVIPSRIKVEDVTDDTSLILADDLSPQFKDSYWIGNAPHQQLSDASTSWIYDLKPTIKVFKVTISSADQPDRVLHQPAYYSIQMKAGLLQAMRGAK